MCGILEEAVGWPALSLPTSFLQNGVLMSPALGWQAASDPPVS